MDAPFLEYEITGLMGHVEHPQAPHIEAPAEDLLINAIDFAYAEGKLSLTLLVTACFAQSYVEAFQRFAIAPVILLENAGTGEAAAFSTADPHKRYPRMEGPNFRSDAAKPAESSSGGEVQVLQGIQIPLSITVDPPGFHPSLFITCVLQNHVSNTLAVNLKEEKIASYRYGKPHRLELPPVPEDE